MWLEVLVGAAVLFFVWRSVRPFVGVKHSTVTHNKQPGPTYFKNRQGLWLYYHYSPVQSKETRGRVFFAHGFGDHSQRRWEFIQAANNAGYAFFSLDHQGFGRSEGDRAHVEKFSHYVDDYEDFYALINKKYPEFSQLPTFLVGPSMGGAISILLAQRNSKPWRGLILLAPAIIPDAAAAKPWMVTLASLLANTLPKMAPLSLDPNRGSSDPDARKAFIADPLTYSAPSGMRVRWGNEMMGAMKTVQNLVPSIEWPFVVYQGTNDYITNPQGVEFLHANAKSKDKTLQMLEGWWHALFEEPKRHELYNEIVKWMDDRC